MKNVCKLLVVVGTLIVLIPYTYAQEWTKLATPSEYLSGIENTGFGLYAGEYNSLYWLNPYNGVYMSRDLGATWQQSGLAHHGVTDIKVCGSKLYATTVYAYSYEDAGLYVSTDKGITWQHLGPAVSASSIACDAHSIYLGTYTNGLWVSLDAGQTWTQKTENGDYIKNVAGGGGLALAAINYKVYKSMDYGDTWEEIPEFANKGIIYLYTGNKWTIAGSRYSSYMFISTDQGETWKNVPSFGNESAGALTMYDQLIFATKKEPEGDRNFTVYVSSDFGTTWTNTGLENPQESIVRDLAWVYSGKPYLFVLTSANGIYRTVITETIAGQQFLDIPWDYTNKSELLDRATSFFDHGYPLLGYNYFTEPAADSATVVNYLGEKAGPPQMYYSSHSGYDYALSYGTPVKAAAAGQAVYYYCGACGNTIKINHPNGVQTIYEHLQRDGLLTTSTTTPVFVNAGDVIGKVGMTGNTTGPHLHFEVSKGTFPDGRTDPYGWLDTDYEDPWPLLTWTDALGAHQGASSEYLWQATPTTQTQIIANTGEALLENKELIFTNLNTPLTIVLQNALPPIASVATALTYIPNTAFVANAYDSLKNRIEVFSNLVQITINLATSDLSNIALESLRISYFDENQQTWLPLDSVFNPQNSTISALTNHFSHFAVTGNKLDANAPLTTLTVYGNKQGNWYKTFPTINLAVTDPEGTEIRNIFYKLNNTEGWQQYSEPFTLSRNGIFELAYKSEDNWENLEETHTHVLCINTDNRWTKTLQVIHAGFSIE